MEYKYDAFGNEMNKVDSDANPFRYCGEYYDKEIDSIYLRARYYKPVTGRFITEDPVKDGLNWYAYCDSNPVLFIDLNGMKKEDAQYKYRFRKNPWGGMASIQYWSNQNDIKSIYSIVGLTYKGQHSNVEIYGHFNTLEIDTDGGKAQPGEKWHNDETSFKYSDTNKSLDAYSIHYVVLPHNYNGTANIRNGDIAVVIDHKNKTFVYAIVGDSGNSNVFNEVSISVAYDLGYQDASWKSDASGGDFVIIYFPGSGNDQWTTEGGQNQINSVGCQYFVAPTGYTQK